MLISLTTRIFPFLFCNSFWSCNASTLPVGVSQTININYKRKIRVNMIIYNKMNLKLDNCILDYCLQATIIHTNVIFHILTPFKASHILLWITDALLKIYIMKLEREHVILYSDLINSGLKLEKKRESREFCQKWR